MAPRGAIFMVEFSAPATLPVVALLAPTSSVGFVPFNSMVGVLIGCPHVPTSYDGSRYCGPFLKCVSCAAAAAQSRVTLVARRRNVDRDMGNLPGELQRHYEMPRQTRQLE